MAYGTLGTHALETVDGLGRELLPWQWYHHLVLAGHSSGRPVSPLTDRQSLNNAALWLLLVLVVLYGDTGVLVRLVG